jgi:hypothetical protein
MLEPRAGDDLSRPVVVGIVVGVGMMVLTALLGLVLAQLFSLGGREICPEGLCAFWAYYGRLGAGPACVICGLAAGSAAHSKGRHRATKTRIWRAALIAAAVTWLVAVAIALAVNFHLYGALPPGPENLFLHWFG